MRKMRRIDAIVVHHTGRDASTKASIWRTHVLVNKWTSWGYHAIANDDGTVEPLRDERRPGAHTKRFNAHSLAIVFADNCDAHMPTASAHAGAVEKVAEWVVKYDVPIERVVGHWETPMLGAAPTKKRCPGRFVDMNAFRRLVAQRVEEMHRAE